MNRVQRLIKSLIENPAKLDNDIVIADAVGFPINIFISH
jgi:hypothetical protein